MIIVSYQRQKKKEAIKKVATMMNYNIYVTIEREKKSLI